MSSNSIEALIFIQNWGDKKHLVAELNKDKHVISVFHIMGRFSYLLDVNFDNKSQLEQWINKYKSMLLASGVPVLKDIQTQKIIRVFKKKENFSLEDYENVKEKYHFFMIINAPHHGEKLIDAMKSEDSVYSTLHIQGYNSLVAEIITDSQDDFCKFLESLKDIQSIQQIDILEVLHVDKYRNQVMDNVGNLVYPDKDIREMYIL